MWGLYPATASLYWGWPLSQQQTSGRPFMLEINPINHLIKDLAERTDVLRGYL